MCNLHFSCRPINIPRPMRMYQPCGVRGCRIWCECFFPAIVYADFETAVHNAVTTVWPGLEVKACRFHLGQSWWRKIQSVGLSKQNGEKDYEVNQFLKKISGLSLWPPVKVCDCFALEILSNLPNDKRVEQFCDYLLENYIEAHSTFGPNVLHHHHHWGQ